MAMRNWLRGRRESAKRNIRDARVYASHCLALLLPSRTPRFASFYGELTVGDINRWSEQAIENFIEEARIQQATQFSMLTSAHSRTRFAFGTGLGGFILALGTYEQSGVVVVTAWWTAAAVFFVGLWGAAANLVTKDLVAFNDVLLLSNEYPPPSQRSLAHALPQNGSASGGVPWSGGFWVGLGVSCGV